MNRAEIRAAESRRAVPVGVATFLAVVLILVSGFVSAASGSGAADFLRSAHEHKGSVALSGIMQALGFLLLIAPLHYLFAAVRVRSERVRPQLIGLVVAAPIFLAVSAGLTIGARGEAADQFVAGEAKSTLSKKEANEKCLSDRKDEGAKEFGEEFEPRKGETALAACERRKIEDEEASNALGEASLAPIVTGLGLAGGLGLVAVFFYCGLWSMRTGLLTRFWGSLGMVAGVAFLLGPLSLIAMVWLVYFALLLLGWVPGGKTPAWEAAEAVPLPTPGEKAAAELEPSREDDQPAEPNPSEEPEVRRKRKRRDDGQSE